VIYSVVTPTLVDWYLSVYVLEKLHHYEGDIKQDATTTLSSDVATPLHGSATAAVYVQRTVGRRVRSASTQDKKRCIKEGCASIMCPQASCGLDC
jgi:hypothetical protein